MQPLVSTQCAVHFAPRGGGCLRSMGQLAVVDPVSVSTGWLTGHPATGIHGPRSGLSDREPGDGSARGAEPILAAGHQAMAVIL